MKDGDAEKQRSERQERSDGGMEKADGISNREKETKIVEACEGRVVKALKVQSDEDLWAGSTSADTGKRGCGLLLPTKDLNSILRCCRMQILQLREGPASVTSEQPLPVVSSAVFHPQP